MICYRQRQGRDEAVAIAMAINADAFAGATAALTAALCLLVEDYSR